MTTLIEQTRELWEKDELPEDLSWIADLLPRHQRLFFAELQHQWGRYCATGNATPLLELLEDWQATSEVDASPEHSAFLLSPKDESEYDEWKTAS